MPTFTARDAATAAYALHGKHYAPVTTHTIDGQHSVTLWQYKHADSDFAISYGAQYKTGMTYAEAAAELGECLMHAATCAGLMDSEH